MAVHARRATWRRVQAHGIRFDGREKIFLVVADGAGHGMEHALKAMAERVHAVAGRSTKAAA